MTQTYAILSDIHGNSWALEAVLENIYKKGIETIINLGDILYGPLDPEGTARILKDYKAIAVRGNQDRLIYENRDDVAENKTLQYVKEQLSEEQVQWLTELPITENISDEIFCCHGTPANDEAYFIENVSQGTPRLKSNSELQNLTKNIHQPLILCGHSHLPSSVYLANGITVVNPGSVGLPAYSDDFPIAHKMETGSPFASYAILSKHKTRWHILFVKIPYDWESAAQAASKNRREDWAYWIRNGRV